MPRDLTGNVIVLGTATAAGYGLEMVDETMQDTTGLLVGVGVSLAGIATDMFVRNENIRNIGLGIAGGGMGFVGSKTREMRLLTGGTAGAGGAVRVSHIRSPRSATRNASGRSNNSSGSSNNNSNVIEM